MVVRKVWLAVQAPSSQFICTGTIHASRSATSMYVHPKNTIFDLKQEIIGENTKQNLYTEGVKREANHSFGFVVRFMFSDPDL